MSFLDYIGTEFEPFILPIIPKDAPLSPHSKLTPDRLGKVPGLRYPEGWGGFPKSLPWQNFQCTAKHLQGFARWYKEGGFVETAGILARLFPGIDIDFDDASLASVVEAIAFEVFGPTIVRTRPNSGKRLLMYRFAGDTAPLLKIRRVYRTLFGDQGAIEILASGQQYLIEGMHPSGVCYEWRMGLTPVAIGVDHIPFITEELVGRFIQMVHSRFAELGIDLVKGGGNIRFSGNESPRTPVGPDHPDLCRDLKMLEDLLTNYLPVDRVEFATYDGWMNACIAIVTACGKDEGFYDIFANWSDANPENVDLTRAKWESVKESSIGWSYLCNIAHEYGYYDDVKEMFDALPDDEDQQSAASSGGAQSRGPLRGPIPKLMPADFDVRKLPRRQFILGNRFMAGAVTVGAGAPGAGKSNVAIISALAIATGQPLTGEPVYRSGRVWIHNNEESIEELYRRIGGMLQCHGIDFASARENIFATSGLDERLIVAIKLKDIVRRTEAVADMIAAINENGIVHIVIDPFVSTHRGVSENSNEEIEQVAEALRYIAHETGCSIDLIHHTLKPHSRNTEEQAGDMHAARGASSLIAAARSMYTVSKMSGKTAERMGLHRAEAGRLIRLDQGKGNYTARDTDERWFELEPFNIRNGGDGADDLFVVDGDTIAVPKPWQPPNPATEQTTPAEDREATRLTRLQRVRDIVVRAMQSGRCEISKVLGSIEHEFLIKASTARNLIKEAIPERDGMTVEVDGHRYVLTIERQLPSPPGRLFIIRKPYEQYSEAA